MRTTFERCNFEGIAPLRERYRKELNCQIVHDSAHYRENCSQSFLATVDGQVVGYGSAWTGSFWMTAGSIFEFYITPEHRSSGCALFENFVRHVQPSKIYAQTNDPFLGVFIFSHVRQIEVRHILF